MGIHIAIGKLLKVYIADISGPNKSLTRVTAFVNVSLILLKNVDLVYSNS